MAYKTIGDVNTVTLGGINKETGKKNPTQLEGYYLREEKREDKKYGKGLQPYFVFQTKNGEDGIHGKSHLNKKMKSARPGFMTLVTATGEVLDTGKGNPMKLYKVEQDPDNFIDLTEDQLTTSTSESEPNYEEVDDAEEQSLDADDEVLDEAPPVRAQAPRRPASVVNSGQAAKIQAMLGNRSKS